MATRYPGPPYRRSGNYRQVGDQGFQREQPRREPPPTITLPREEYRVLERPRDWSPWDLKDVERLDWRVIDQRRNQDLAKLGEKVFRYGKNVFGPLRNAYTLFRLFQLLRGLDVVPYRLDYSGYTHSQCPPVAGYDTGHVGPYFLTSARGKLCGIPWHPSNQTDPGGPTPETIYDGNTGPPSALEDRSPFAVTDNQWLRNPGTDWQTKWPPYSVQLPEVAPEWRSMPRESSKPNPFRAPSERTERGPRSLPEEDDDPRSGERPSEVPWPFSEVFEPSEVGFPGPRYEVSEDGSRWLPPRPNRVVHREPLKVNKEKKMRMAASRLIAIRLGGFASEVLDTIGAVWDAIPRKECKGNEKPSPPKGPLARDCMAQPNVSGCTGSRIKYTPRLSPVPRVRWKDANGKWQSKVARNSKGIPITKPLAKDMLKDIYNHFDKIDWCSAVQNFAMEQVKDLFYGLPSRYVSREFTRRFPWTGRGPGTGPAM